MKRKGIILINAYAPDDNTRQLRRFKEEFNKLGVAVDVRRNNFFPLAVSGGEIELRDFDCDFCLYLDKDKYVAEMLERRGVRLFNHARAIELCDDKMRTHIALAGGGIPMPDTLPGLLCYDGANAVSPEALDIVERRLGYPMVIKQSYGSLGKGVFKADSREELERIAEENKLTPHLFQKYIAASHGRDFRVIVVGGKALGGILRVSNGDFRSNIGLGGKARRAENTPDITRYAERAAEILGLDYCGIDFLLSPEPLLCEVNSNAFFDAFEAATGINVAGAYAEHILKNI